MDRADVFADKNLRSLPYKIEPDRYGNIAMNSASNKHGRFRLLIGSFPERKLGGETISERSAVTPEGVKVADVAWCSPEFLARHGYQTPCPAAPEICAEVRSPTHSREEIRAKAPLYLEKGAREPGSSSKPARCGSSAR